MGWTRKGKGLSSRVWLRRLPAANRPFQRLHKSRGSGRADFHHREWDLLRRGISQFRAQGFHRRQEEAAEEEDHHREAGHHQAVAVEGVTHQGEEFLFSRTEGRSRSLRRRRRSTSGILGVGEDGTPTLHPDGRGTWAVLAGAAVSLPWHSQWPRRQQTPGDG